MAVYCEFVPVDESWNVAVVAVADWPSVAATLSPLSVPAHGRSLFSSQSSEALMSCPLKSTVASCFLLPAVMSACSSPVQFPSACPFA